ncbi:MAG: hypothetical protein P1U38_01925 [Aeromicrobium sp.]|uniref:hypothetical protein n=1 Tax=Aeromicrobium sp. TaxID=1871063 RepID=UPI0025C0259E|nr:hypothetical protein [Aeromicrobium sp.]MCK5890511.1 hypothetical protein [Aeromicrobium sp.]MDF1703515.1 hypothetical protein [Aeromicrobium sp.]
MAQRNLMTSNSSLAALALTSTLFGLISIGEAGRRTVQDLRQRGGAGRSSSADAVTARRRGRPRDVGTLAA